MALYHQEKSPERTANGNKPNAIIEDADKNTVRILYVIDTIIRFYV